MQLRCRVTLPQLFVEECDLLGIQSPDRVAERSPFIKAVDPLPNSNARIADKTCERQRSTNDHCGGGKLHKPGLERREPSRMAGPQQRCTCKRNGGCLPAARLQDFQPSWIRRHWFTD